MFKRGIEGLPYFLGVRSLADLATRRDRVCVLNILGGESRQVTPVCHAFSGGNVAFGTSPGRGGQVLPTPIGEVPVFNSVREGLDAGLSFNTGVVYLPPAAVRDGVAELIRVNPDLEKIVVITEKISVHDAREIRALAQAAGIDVFGGNCLGVADSWNRVRIGGALGGDTPEGVLLRGSVAVFSNSGGFTTTIAQYLATAGWGTTTLISSGKDVYIHYAAQDFALALANDPRSAAAVLYCEPGGYYEQGIEFGKPVVACVVGRWKSRLTRPVGHAGAMAGGGDTAECKERWFMEAFGVDGLFTPETPVVSARGAVVANIAHIPAALTAVMQLNGASPDFAPRGDLSLKAWMADDRGLRLPPELALAPCLPPPPYDEQLAALSEQMGAVVRRQVMRDRSGATRLDPATQTVRLHGHSALDLAGRPLEAVFALPLVHELVDDEACALLAVALAAEMELQDDPALAAAEASRQAGNSPSTVMAAAAAMVGPRRIARAHACLCRLIDMFAAAGLGDARDRGFDLGRVEVTDADRALFAATGEEADHGRVQAMLDALARRGARSPFLDLVTSAQPRPSRDAVLAAICASLAWGPLKQRRISRVTAESLPWQLRLFGVMLGASIPAERHQGEALCGAAREARFGDHSLADLLFLALTGRAAAAGEAELMRILVTLLISNGPGAISLQGAKGAVSADGPETPRRVQINKAMMGFLSHTGYSHGGNGFEGIAFLLERFRHQPLADPSAPGHGLDLRAMAIEVAQAYKAERRAAKEAGQESPPALPGVHHPVFRGQQVNHDPRERFVARALAERGETNLFLAFYQELVQALYDCGASPYVFCVNADGVIAAVLLSLFWEDYRSGRMSAQTLEAAAFNLFLYGRMVGAAAEIDDHLNRGRNMDTRTPPDRCEFVV